MKYIPSMVVAALLLCTPALKAQAALSADDVKFLKGCGVSQADINVIPNLTRIGQNKVRSILIDVEARTCDDVAPYIASRDFIKKFTPPPNQSPMPPRGYDNDFLTLAESQYVNSVNRSILDKVFDWFVK